LSLLHLICNVLWHVVRLDIFISQIKQFLQNLFKSKLFKFSTVSVTFVLVPKVMRHIGAPNEIIYKKMDCEISRLIEVRGNFAADRESDVSRH
jgi:hypothetical protein